MSRLCALVLAAATLVLAAAAPAQATVKVRDVRVSPGVWEQWLEPVISRSVRYVCTPSEPEISFQILPGDDGRRPGALVIPVLLVLPNGVPRSFPGIAISDAVGFFVPGRGFLARPSFLFLQKSATGGRGLVQGVGRFTVRFGLFGNFDTDRNPLLNFSFPKSLRYVGVSKPAGACDAAGLPKLLVEV